MYHRTTSEEAKHAMNSFLSPPSLLAQKKKTFANCPIGVFQNRTSSWKESELIKFDQMTSMKGLGVA